MNIIIEIYSHSVGKKQISFNPLEEIDQLPALFADILSVIISMLEIVPYFMKSCLTSLVRLIRGTPNTSKCLDSFTIV